MSGLLYLFLVVGAGCWTAGWRLTGAKTERIKTSNSGWGFVKIRRSHTELWGSRRNEVVRTLGSSFHIQRTRFYQISQKTGRDWCHLKSQVSKIFLADHFGKQIFIIIFFYLKCFLFNNESYTAWYQNSGVSIQEWTPDWMAMNGTTPPTTSVLLLYESSNTSLSKYEWSTFFWPKKNTSINLLNLLKYLEM